MDPRSDDSTTFAGSHLHGKYHGYQWYLMVWLAFTLLVLCFLIAGLTLGVCGLDMTWLEMRSITGTAKQRYASTSPSIEPADKNPGSKFV